MTLHSSHFPVYTEDYCGINETGSPGKEEDKSKQKGSEKINLFCRSLCQGTKL